jgi:hypothetical protein
MAFNEAKIADIIALFREESANEDPVKIKVATRGGHKFYGFLRSLTDDVMELGDTRTSDAPMSVFISVADIVAIGGTL